MPSSPDSPRPRGARAEARRAGAALLASLALALAPFPCGCAADAATLAGRVVEHAGGRPVDGAAVRVLETGQARRTDALGRFSFAGLPPGTYTLSAHHLAYADVERAVRLSEGAADTVTLRVHDALYRTDEVLVRSARSLAALRSSPGASEAWIGERLREGSAVTVSEALGSMPGVALARDGSWETALSIRGLGRSSVVALADHARIETATDIAGGLSLFDPAELERVEVMKSPGSVLFGSGALGGAVHLMTRRARFSPRRSWSAEWSEGVTSADRGVANHFAAESASPRHALRVSGGLRRAEDVRTPEGPLPESHYGDWSLNASLALPTTGEQSLFASWQRAQAEDTGIPGGRPIAGSAVARYTLARRERVALEYTIPNAWGAVPLVTVRLSRQDITRNVEIRQSPVVIVTPHAVHATTSGQVEARLLPGRGQVLIAGAEAWRRALDSRRERRQLATGVVTGERPVPLASFLSAGAYAQHEWTAAAERVRVVTGARWDRGRTRNDPALNPEYVLAGGVPQVPVPGQALLWPALTTHDESWSASSGVHVAVSPAWAMSAMFATSFRSPSLEERFQFLDLGSSVRLGNPALAPERGLSLDLGTRLDLGRTRARADLFGHRLTNLVTDVPGAWQGRPAWFKANIGRARLYGFEVSAERELARRAVLRASVSYVRGEDTHLHANLPQVAPLSGEADLGLGAFGAGTFHLTCAAAHAQGNPAAGETPTPGFAVWGASFASRTLHAGAVTCGVRAGVENALDRAYRLHLSTLRGVVRLEPGRNGYVTATFGFGEGGAK